MLFYTENPTFSAVELFRIVDVPLKDSTIGFTLGKDGYPAFEFTADANATKPAEAISFNRLFKNFAIAALVKPYNESGGFLFSVVDSTESVVQFGLEISKTNVENAPFKISLYHTDMTRKSASFRIAEFPVPSLVGKWNTISIKVSDDIITFAHDCGLESSVKSPVELEELTFEEGSVIYVAQAGTKIGKNFVVSNLEFPLYYYYSDYCVVSVQSALDVASYYTTIALIKNTLYPVMECI